MSRDHPNYYIIENGQNTEKSPGDLRRLAVTGIIIIIIIIFCLSQKEYKMRHDWVGMVIHWGNVQEI